MSNFEEFVHDLKKGYVEENHLCDFLYENVVPCDHRIFLAKHKVTISMILNGRLIVEGPDRHPIEEIVRLIKCWNKTVGYEVIFTDGYI